ncbi:MAG: DNA repair protein RadA, partial [Gammaproteobacteria bacterium]
MSKPSVKTRLAYVCNACGASLNKWAGRCPECGAWNSIEEIPELPAAARGRQGYAGRTDGVGVLSLEMVGPEREIRTSSGIAELDRVLGGGLVAGSVVLIGGDPGIGKSTLLLQACAALAGGAAHPAPGRELAQVPPPDADRPILYVTGEESPQQVSLRARRLGLSGAGIRLLAETGVERILAA